MARGTQVVKQSKSVVKQSEAVVKRSVALARMSRWLEARRCQYLSCCTSKASTVSTDELDEVALGRLQETDEHRSSPHVVYQRLRPHLHHSPTTVSALRATIVAGLTLLACDA